MLVKPRRKHWVWTSCSGDLLYYDATLHRVEISCVVVLYSVATLYVIDSCPGAFHGEQHLLGSDQWHLQGIVSSSPDWEGLLLLWWSGSRLQVEGTQLGHLEGGRQLIPSLFCLLLFDISINICMIILFAGLEVLRKGPQ